MSENRYPSNWEKSLARIVAGVIVSALRFLESVFKAVFSILSSLA